MDIVEMIDDCVIPCQRPVVYISGGLDSCIVLHHLVKKSIETVYTYSAKFGVDGDESRFAEMLSEHYGTNHTTIDIIDFIPRLPEILEGMDQPYFNVWSYLLAEKAIADYRKSVYIGEGSDERFGGYDNKDYVEGWVDHFAYVIPVYQQIHKKLGLHLEIPFERLDWKKVAHYYAPPTKAVLKEAYKDILPKFILERKKAPPAYVNYWQMWNKCIKNYFPNYHPEKYTDVRDCLKLLAMKAWVESNGKRFSI